MKVLRYEKVVLAEDLEVLAVFCEGNTVYLGGGICVRVRCDKHMLSHIAQHTHGVAWGSCHQSWLYVRDLGSLDGLRRPEALTGEMQISCKGGEHKLEWECDTCPAAVAKLLSGEMVADPAPARPFARELRREDCDESHTFWIGDDQIMVVPKSDFLSSASAPVL